LTLVNNKTYSEPKKVTRKHNNKKRSSIEIYRDLLKSLIENNDYDDDSSSIFNLMYSVRITNSYSFYSKLKPLLDNSYIYCPSMKRFKITDKGKEYLKALEKVLSVEEKEDVIKK